MYSCIRSTTLGKTFEIDIWKQYKQQSVEATFNFTWNAFSGCISRFIFASDIAQWAAAVHKVWRTCRQKDNTLKNNVGKNNRIV